MRNVFGIMHLPSRDYVSVGEYLLKSVLYAFSFNKKLNQLEARVEELENGQARLYGILAVSLFIGAALFISTRRA